MQGQQSFQSSEREPPGTDDGSLSFSFIDTMARDKK